MATSDRRAPLPRSLVAGAALLAWCIACATCGAGGSLDEAYRLLDRTCEKTLPDGPACEAPLSVRVEGITADTLGFRLGPTGADRVTIHLQAIDSIQGPIEGQFDLEMLAARTPGGAKGEVSAVFDPDCASDPDCPSFSEYVVLEDDYQWYPVILGQPRPGAFSYEATLTLKGRNADIADIRTVHLEPAGCSIAGPLGAIH